MHRQAGRQRVARIGFVNIFLWGYLHGESPHAFSVTFIPLEGVNVFKLNLSLMAVLLLSGCSSDLVLNPPKQPEYKSMPEITQSVTPSQQRAIMAGERPDWSERMPTNTIKRY